ncbi:MAG TPA: hypothetical protein VGS19_24125, partial [Streptosporangiaceae bacterium]|nr:hypothetical protein [Streptosporangiaceae bacterium]
MTAATLALLGASGVAQAASTAGHSRPLDAVVVNLHQAYLADLAHTHAHPIGDIAYARGKRPTT